MPYYGSGYYGYGAYGIGYIQPPPGKYLYPSPYPSPGLCQAVWDSLGTAKLESAIRGKIDNAIYTIDVNHQFIIPVSAHGDKVAWVRGVWLQAVDFKYDGFKADPRSGQPDITNYLTNATRSASGTTVTCSALAQGTSVQVYYSYETGQTAKKGEALDGWPILARAVDNDDYGTAIDGDNYILQGLYYAHQLTGQNKYKMAGEHLAKALIEWGAQEGNELNFDRPLFNQKGGDGLYNYFGGGATFSWNNDPAPGGRTGRALKITSNYSSGGWAGWGWWPTRDNKISPIKQISFDLFGDGSGGKILITSYTDRSDLTQYRVSYNVPMLSKDASAWKTVTILPADLWRTGNIVYDGDRADPSWMSHFGDGDSSGTLADVVEDNQGPEGYWRYTAKSYIFSMGSTGTYRDISIGPGSVSSVSTNALKLAMYASVAMTINIRIDDNGGERWYKTVSLQAGWQAVYLPWGGFARNSYQPDDPDDPISSMLSQSGLGSFSAANCVDDNTSTVGWNTNAAVAGAYMKIDFGAWNGKSVVRIRLNMSAAGSTANYTVQRSDDGTVWTDAAINFVPSATGWNEIAFTNAVAHRYWRLYLTNTPGSGPTVNEIEVYTRLDDNILGHAVTEILIDIDSTLGAPTSGEIRFDDIRYDDILTLIGAEVLDGLDFAMPTGNHTVYFDNLKIHQAPVDPYPLLPRWTYAWTQKSSGFGGGKNEYGYGVWRGPSAPGYLHVGGWYQYDRSMAKRIIQFMYDAQQAYISKFNKTGSARGPFMPEYGRWSWEAIADGVLNQWHFKLTGPNSWHGYQWRALAAVAYYYYLTGDTQAKAILDLWMAWINANIITDPGIPSPPVAAWRPPESFMDDGTLRYNYTPIYAHSLIAEACIYKYWRDGDSIASTWYRRLLDDLHYNRKITTGALAGAHESEPTGYSESEIGIALGMLINGRPGGVVNYPLTPTSYDIQDFKDIYTFYTANARDTRPSACNAEWIPIHEWTWSSWHPAANDVMTDDTHADGMTWTEDIGPCFFLPSIIGGILGTRSGWTSSSASLLN